MSESTKTRAFHVGDIAAKIRRRSHARKVEMAPSFYCNSDFAQEPRPIEWRCGTCGLIVSDPCGPCVEMIADDHRATHA